MVETRKLDRIRFLWYERYKDMNASEYKRGKNKDSFAKKQYFF